MKNKKPKKVLKTDDKIIFITLFLALLVFVYIFRLIMLQIFDVYNYSEKGELVSKVGSVVKPNRGNILDRNGKPLAVTQNIESLYLLSVASKEERLEAEKIRMNEERFSKLKDDEKEYYVRTSALPTYEKEDITKIANILSIDEKEIYNLINSKKEGYIYRALNAMQKNEIEILNLKYLQIHTNQDRYYPNNDMLSKVIGFVDEQSQNSYGLEKYYDELLSGKAGYREFFKALHGTEIPYTKSKSIEAKQAKNLVTTIDTDLQNILYQELKNAFYKEKPMAVTAILMNPNNGEVLAMESIPTFNANNPRSLDGDIDSMFLSKIKDEEISTYMLSRWNNEAVMKQYDPGSVYKLITTAVALESNSEIKDKIYQDNGYYDLAEGVRILSWRYWDPHGPQNLKEALKNSSNPVFVQVALDIGKKAYLEYAKPFNFGNKTGVDLPQESSGSYPVSDTISDVDFGALSYGYYSNVTPIQIMSAVNSIVNGGNYYRPHLLKSVVDNDEKVVYENNENFLRKTISEKTSSEVNDYMHYTATSYGLNNNEKYQFGAKTGTSNKYSYKNVFRDKNQKVEVGDAVITSIYVTYPYDAPRYALYVTFDEPLQNITSSETALRLADKIIDRIAEFDANGKTKNTNKYKTVKIPDFVGMTVEKANILAKENNLILTTENKYGRYHIIEKQNLSGGNSTEENTKISISVSDKIEIPNLINMNINDVKKILSENHIQYEIKGEGKIIKSQSIKEGTIIKEKEKIILTVKE